MGGAPDPAGRMSSENRKGRRESDNLTVDLDALDALDPMEAHFAYCDGTVHGLRELLTACVPAIVLFMRVVRIPKPVVGN